MTTVVTAQPNSANDRRWQAFINGNFHVGTSRRELMNPSTGHQLCVVEESSSEQIEDAIRAARQSFDRGLWRNTSAVERGTILRRIADELEKQAKEIALVESLNAGKPLRESLSDVHESANCFRYYAGLITNPSGQTVAVPAPSVSYILREPIGVCAMIVPWNYPLLTAVWKLAPALAAGNSCILKPSEFTPLSALMLARIMQSGGLHDGVLNVVLGDGMTAGEPLAKSMLVDKISFTGSGVTGRKIAAAAIASNLKKVTLELGGKSPLIIFDDVDLDFAVDQALYAIFVHAGQVCSAGSRFLVAEKLFDKFVQKFVDRASRICVGPALDEATEMGPLVSAQQKQRVIDYIETGKTEGAVIATGGNCPSGEKYGKGYFVNPTLFTGATTSMRIVQEEIFGPVATAERFKTTDEAIELANATTYGLAAGVLCNDITRAYSTIKAIRAGVTWINGFHSCYTECPFGGYKQSGWGRECGTLGIEPYTEVKQVNVNMEPGPINWFA